MQTKSPSQHLNVFTILAFTLCLLVISPSPVMSDEADLPNNLKTAYGGIDFTIRTFNLNYNYDPTRQDKHPPKIRLSMAGRLAVGQKASLYNENTKINRVVYDNGWEPTAEAILAVSEKVELEKIEATHGTEEQSAPSRQVINVDIHLPLPPRDAKAIKILEGAVSMYSQEPELHSVLISLTDTNNAESTDAGAFRLKLQNYEDRGYKTVKIVAESIGKTEVRSHDYYQWKLLAKDGKECKRTSQGSSERDDKVTFHISFPCRQKTEEIKGLSASWYDDEGGNKIDIPFSFRDVPLP